MQTRGDLHFLAGFLGSAGRRTMTLSFWWQDVRQAVRLLTHQRVFSLGAVLVLALGIGLATALFSLMNAVFFRPWQVPDADRMAIIRAERAGNEVSGGISIAEYRYLREHSRSFLYITAWQSGPTRMRDGFGQQLSVQSAFVNADYFKALGVTMFSGRGFLADEEDYHAPKTVAIVSYGLWQRQFGADPGLVGRTIRVGRHEFVIVGVAAPEFLDVYRSRRTDLWIPLPAQALLRGSSPNLARFDDPHGEPLRLVAGRLRPGATRASAAQELSRLSRQFRSAAALPSRPIDVIDTRPLSGWPPGSLRAVLPVQALLALAVMLVLLIACANAGNLLLARTLARRRDIAVRFSLGASRARVVRQLLLEAAALSVLAGALGLGFAVSAPGLMLDLGFTFAADGFWPATSVDAIRPSFYALDKLVFWVAVLLASFTTLATGFTPAVRVTRADDVVSFVAERHGSTPGGTRWRIGLLAAQVALTTVLLVGAGLLTRAIAHAASLNPGFTIKDVQVVSVKPDIPAQAILTRGRNFALGLRDALKDGGVGPVAFTQLPPLSDVNYVSMVRRSGEIHSILTRDVSREYFAVLGIRITKGRLPDSDVDSRQLVISEAAARLLWPNADPVGQTFEIAVSRTEYSEYRVVGVSRDVPVRSMSEIEPVIYKMPDWADAMTLLLRNAAPGVGERVRAVASTLEPVVTVTERPMVDYVRDSLATAVLARRVAWAMGGLGLMLAIAGTFGVFAQAVEERRREIAIRVALGANPRRVAAPVLRTFIRGLAWGLAGGLLLSVLSVPLLRHFLYGLNPFDPMAYASVAGILAAASILATWIPVRRVLAVDPAATLRGE